MDKINITIKKTNFDEQIKINKDLLEKYKKMKKQNIPKINNISADEILTKQIKELEKRKKDEMKKK